MVSLFEWSSWSKTFTEKSVTLWLCLVLTVYTHVALQKNLQFFVETEIYSPQMSTSTFLYKHHGNCPISVDKDRSWFLFLAAARMKIEINAMNNIYYIQCLVKYFLIMGTDKCPLSDIDMSWHVKPPMVQ